MGRSLIRPGFRFHPTDDELVVCYLKKKSLGKKLDPQVIAEINIYDFEPWELSAKSILSGDRKWYFFSRVSKKYTSGSRMNRTTKNGYWKGTGKDKEVKHNRRIVAMRKTLIFHVGRNPNGTRTNWVMREFRMTNDDLAPQRVDQDAYVVCKVYEKSGLGPKNGEQYGAAFEFKEQDDHDDDDNEDGSTVTSTMIFGVLVNPNNVNMSSTEAGPSTVTSLTVVGLSGATQMLDPNASISGPSTLIYQENERRFTDDPVNNNTLEVENRKRKKVEVEDRRGKKVMTDPVNDDVMLTNADMALRSYNYDTQICYPDNVNRTSTEAGPSTVTSLTVGLSGTTNMIDPNATTSGPSTLIYQENERRFTDDPVNNNNQEVGDHKGKKVMTDPVNENVLVNDDVMLTNADMALLFRDYGTKEVEDPKGKKVMTVPVDENDSNFEDLMALSNKDLGQDVFNMFSIDEFSDERMIDDEFAADRMTDEEFQKYMEGLSPLN